MYNKEKGIYPAGGYLVGEDIEEGRYLLKSRKDSAGAVSIYESYEKYRKDQMISFNPFDGDYHLSLRDKGMFIVVDNADIQRI